MSRCSPNKIVTCKRLNPRSRVARIHDSLEILQSDIDSFATQTPSLDPNQWLNVGVQPIAHKLELAVRPCNSHESSTTSSSACAPPRICLSHPRNERDCPIILEARKLHTLVELDVLSTCHRKNELATGNVYPACCCIPIRY